MKKSKALTIKNPNAAGIDLGNTHHYVAIGSEKSTNNIRVFSTYTKALKEMAEWLVEMEIDTVAMESTSIFWLGPYDILEEHGIEVHLVNARHVKNVPGRKSDIQDCQWLQQLHSFGLLRASFVPKDKIRELRTYVRQRESILNAKTQALMHISKALDLMNIKLHSIISDLSGATAMKIIRDINDGVSDPKKLAEHRNLNMKATKEEIQLSLEGNYKEEYLFILKQSLDTFDYFTKKMFEADQYIEKILKELVPENPPKYQESTELANKRKRRGRKPRKNEYRFNAKEYVFQIYGVDLTAIDGVEEMTALEILAECGSDFSKWKTAKHFSSWLGLAPLPQISGGKVIKHQVNKTNQRANLALRRAANSLHGSKSALGAQFRKIKARKGPKVAVKAMARKIAVIIYNMITKQQEFRGGSEEKFEKEYHKQLFKKLTKQARRIGYSLHELEISD